MDDNIGVDRVTAVYRFGPGEAHVITLGGEGTHYGDIELPRNASNVWYAFTATDGAGGGIVVYEQHPDTGENPITISVTGL